jgi:hypothetical protein
MAWLLLFLTLFVAPGCDRTPDSTSTLAATLTPSLSPTPSATPTPTPTATAPPTLTPTPTATPIPPVRLSIEFPKPVNALEPAPIRALVEEPPGINANVQLSARVIDANDALYATFGMHLESRDGGWVSDEPLQLPLEPTPYPGVWHVIIDIQADLPVRGYRDRVFTPQWVPYHVLTATLPTGVALHVPQAFGEIRAQGDTFAGLHVWQYRDCEVTLAWAPGPTEALLYDNALVMAELLYDPEYEITVQSSHELTWGEEEWTAFLFFERWRGQRQDAPAETLVVQGPDFRLYALRIRALNGETIHPLCKDVRNTLQLVEE